MGIWSDLGQLYVVEFLASVPCLVILALFHSPMQYTYVPTVTAYVVTLLTVAPAAIGVSTLPQGDDGPLGRELSVLAFSAVVAPAGSFYILMPVLPDLLTLPFAAAGGVVVLILIETTGRVIRKGRHAANLHPPVDGKP